MRILTALVTLAVLASPAAASDTNGFVFGAGYASIFTAQSYIDNQPGFQVWVSRAIQPDLLLRGDFTRAGLGEQYVGVMPVGGLVPPEYQPVTESIDRHGSLSLFDLTLSGTHSFSPRLAVELGAGFGLTWVRMDWSGDSTGFSTQSKATRPHALALAGVSARPIGAWPVGLQVRFVIRRVAGDANRATDSFEPFGDPFNVSDLKASLFWQI